MKTKNLFYIILLVYVPLFSQINISENPLFNEFFGNDEFELVLEKTDKILERGTHEEKVSANLIKASYILYRDDTEKALQYLNRAKALLDIDSDPINLYIYYYIEALYNMYIHKNFERLNSFVEAIKVKKKHNIIDPFFVIEVGLVEYYLEIENYPKVFSISNSVFKQLKENNIKYNSNKSALFRFRAVSARNLKRYDESKQNLDSAMLYAKYYNDSTQIARVIKYKADLLLDLKQYDKALETATKAKELFERHDQKNMVVIYDLLGFIAFEQKQYDKAKIYLEKVLNQDYIYYLTDYVKTSQYYRRILEKENEIEKAYLTLKKEDSIKHAISGQNIDNKILNLELDYQEFQNNAILEKSKKRTWWIIYMLIFSLMGIGLLSFLLYQRSVNIKKLKKTQISIENTNRKLKKVNFKLSKFGKIVSHDLKAPIRSIGSLATFILEDEPQLSKNSKKYIHLIHESVMATENLILNMLTLARAENNTFEKRKISFDQIIQQVEVNLFYDIHRSNATLTFIKKPQYIYGNKILLIQLFQNFIQNSIKYRDENRPLIIEINYHPEENKITIEDNGIGIDADNLDKLFKAYNQENFESVDRGVGLGLYITKTIADLHEIIIKILTKKHEKTIINLYFEKNHIQ
ncbi:histidine kinase [Flavobacteriaceae bacterium UJ101]|nr:histidine kinase [Flavobacteriaceae bacterium UJ101]